ncbi:MAG: phosphatidylglycerophosphatase A, partial [Kangiellaceae bacterium]|nr:phosphatidylglycerophosphatase A [Kangiellaceae bacterium]
LLKTHDHPGIVWDEFAGMFVTFLFIPITWQNLIAGFILFRLFDILKPWPIKWVDKKVSGGLGIMLDDILAGLAACGCLHGLNLLW